MPKGKPLPVYILRLKPGAPVSTPLQWKELKKGLLPTDFNIHNILQRINKKGDIFKPILGKGINIDACLRKRVDKYEFS